MRTDLEALCPECRLRLHRAVERCPFCRAPTLLSGRRDRQRQLVRSSWALTAPGRFLRWMSLLLGGPLMGLLPLIVVVLPVLILLFGPPVDTKPSEMILSSLVSGPAIFLGLTILVPIALAAMALPVVLLLGIGEAVTKRRRVEVCPRDRPPARPAHRLGRWLRATEEKLKLVKRKARGKVVAIFAVSLSLAVVAISFVVRSEDLLPWNGGLIGLLGAGVIYFAGALWLDCVLTALDWMQGGASFFAGPEERGRRRFDGERERREMLADWTADRQARGGEIHARQLVRAPLGGEEVVAFRLLGQVGGWAIDDAVVAGEPTLRVEGGADVRVRATDWAVPLAVSDPAPVPMTPELEGFLGRLGVPAGRAVLAEAVLRPGDLVEVRADASEEHAPGQGYRDERILLLTDDSRRPVVLTKG